MDYSLYLNKLALTKKNPSLDYLNELILAHRQVFVVGNLFSSHQNDPLELSVDFLFQKLVEEHKCGLGIELNALFLQLLNHLKFDVCCLEVRSLNKENLGPKFDHMALRVNIEGDYFLVDVGSFSIISYAIPMFELDHYEEELFRIDTIKHGKVLSVYNAERACKALYYFRDNPVFLKYFNLGLNYHVQSNKNKPQQSLKLSRLDEDLTALYLLENKLITNSRQEKIVRVLWEKNDWEKVVTERFEVELAQFS